MRQPKVSKRAMLNVKKACSCSKNQNKARTMGRGGGGGIYNPSGMIGKAVEKFFKKV